jgi:hypothetical protein
MPGRTEALWRLSVLTRGLFAVATDVAHDCAQTLWSSLGFCEQRYSKRGVRDEKTGTCIPFGHHLAGGEQSSDKRYEIDGLAANLLPSSMPLDFAL